LSKFWDFDKVYDAKAIFRLFGQPLFFCFVGSFIVFFLR